MIKAMAKGRRMKRLLYLLFGILLILPLVIGVTPSLQWGDTPLKTNLPPVIITGKSTFKILESRRIPIPSPFLPGQKERPAIVVSSATEPNVPEGNKHQPTPQTPGCAYRSSITSKIATVFKKDEAYDKRGKYLFLNRRYTEAIETFRHLIDTYPQSRKIGEAYFWIGESYFQLNDVMKAEQNFKVTAKKYPSSAYSDYAIYSLGWISYLKKDFDRAIKYFKQGVFSYPNSPIYHQMLFWLAESFMQNNKTDQAYAYFLKLLSKSPGPSLKIPALFEVAKIQFMKKDYLSSKKTLKGLKLLNVPDSLIPKIHLLVGWCDYFLKDVNALKTFNKVLTFSKLAPALKAEAIYGKGLSAIQQGNPEIAENILNTTGPQFPWFGELTIELANYYFGKKDYKNAGRSCSRIFQVLRKTPYIEKAYMIIGNCAYNTKDYSHAAEYYTHVIMGKVKKYQPIATFAKGLSFYQIGKFRDAIDSWEALLEHFPEFERRRETLYWLGSAYLNLHKQKLAVSYFNQLKGNNQFYPKALIQLAQYWFSQQSWKNALNVLEQFLKLYPSHPYTGFAKGMMGEIYFNLKNYKEASKWLSIALKDHYAVSDHEFHAKLYFILGQVYYREGNFKRATIYFDVVSSKLPRSSFSDNALYWKSMSYYSRQAFEKAILSFKDLIKTFPDSPMTADATIKIADCYYNLKKYTLSDAYYQKAATHFKDKKVKEKATYGRVLSLYQRGDFPHFFPEARKFVNSYPDSPLSLDVIQLLTEYYGRLGETDKEIDLLDRFLKGHKISPQADSIRLKLAKLFMQKGLYDSALVQLRAISSKKSRSPFASVAEKEMGDIYFKQKLYSEAVVHYRRYMSSGKLSPSTTKEVRRQLVSSLINSGKLKEAESEIRLGVKTCGIDWAAPLYIELGKAYQRRKMYKSALISFQNAAKSLNTGIKCRAMIAISETYRKTKNYDKSLKTLLMVRYSYPECRASSEEALLDLAVLFGEKGRKDEARQLLGALLKSHDKKIKRLAQKALNRLH